MIRKGNFYNWLLSYRDNDGRTALSEILEYVHRNEEKVDELIGILLDYGADPNYCSHSYIKIMSKTM